VGVVVVDDISGLLLRVAQPSAGEFQSPQLPKLLPVRDDWADDGHRPLHPVDRHHIPQWQIQALLLQQPLQPGVVELPAKLLFTVLGADHDHQPQIIWAKDRRKSFQVPVQLAIGVPTEVINYREEDFSGRTLEDQVLPEIQLAAAIRQQGRFSNELEAKLDKSRLVKQDTLGKPPQTATEREWVMQNRTPEAEHWNVMTDLRPEHFKYVP
jgi:hypothetical protein